MVAFYVFSLVLGGGFLGLSLLGDLFGGHGDVDLSTDVALDTDLSFDTDMDVQLDADVGHLDLEAASGGAEAVHAGHTDLAAHTYGSAVAAKIFSVRTVIYALFGFGAVGTLLTWVLPVGSSVTTAAFAVVGGMLSGTVINAAFGWVKRSDSGAVKGDDAFVGQLARVTLPVTETGGKVVVEMLGHTVELRALPHSSAADQGDPSAWRSVVVVDMQRGVALVAPAPQELLGA
jgi:membrane protein implicated in regulation of membrane protease activity